MPKVRAGALLEATCSKSLAQADTNQRVNRNEACAVYPGIHSC